MANNQYINKVVYDGGTLIDITDTTATESDVAEGVVFYKANGERSVGTASGGGDMTLDSLWTNSDDTTGFEAQTIPLDLSSYKLVLIVFKVGHNVSEYVNAIIEIGVTRNINIPWATIRGREVTTASNGVTFGNGYIYATYANTTKTNNKNHCIPCIIYGIK